ncbi:MULTISPECIES: DUF5995 family protein [unclassified Streptomyces]|uniref:DUF5995 family protein n=1 Tax=unclassified Streptomyces TaxID=2593676 RepID=UPI0020338522|nr:MULTISPECIES: DUF5995 family protein [unclassified Streptomyces]MCM2418235.1 DUF5995 family protein [Streptomyces sp. RKAG293]MCM2429598.1 DUF5995 family protein [Streptomyces sp. RKAG337]
MTTVRRTVPGDVDEVVARMRALDAALPPHDGVAVFNRVYLSVTEEMRRLMSAGVFDDPHAAAELDVRFAGRYLAAVGAVSSRRRAPACWRPLLQLRGHRGVRPLQFALAGINAHIGHDLALALVDTCRALDREPLAMERDFERIGDVLVAIEERVREDLMPGPDLLDVADPLTHLVGSWSLERARDAAWAASRLLWSLRHTGEMYRECVDRLDAGVGLVGRFLLTPLAGR